MLSVKNQAAIDLTATADLESLTPDANTRIRIRKKRSAVTEGETGTFDFSVPVAANCVRQSIHATILRTVLAVARTSTTQT
jgi:hypothetical protein